MDEAARSSFAAWSDFYVIVGSSAAALTGLQFVVMALVNDLRRPPSEQTVAAFSTPTIVHFSIALLTSAIVVAPWLELWQTGLHRHPQFLGHGDVYRAAADAEIRIPGTHTD